MTSTQGVAQLCALCGLDAGARPLEEGGRSFCCAGCLNVHAILSESGALRAGVDPRDTELFRESLDQGLVSSPGSRPVTSAAAALPGVEVQETAFSVSGMWCTSCAWLIERALSRMPGVLGAEAMFASDLVKVRYQPRFVPVERIRKRIERLGYGASDHAEASSSAAGFRSYRRDLALRLGVAAFLWLNVMTLSMIFYVGYFEPVAPGAHRYIPLLLAALTAPAVFFSAWPILRAAAAGLREYVLRMEALLSLGILAAYGYSSVLACFGGRHYYFDTACAIITFVLAGKLIEAAAKERTMRAVTLLHQMMPRKARLLADASGREHFAGVEQLRAGQLFFVKPGERIPADGVVERGESYVDESVITGESRPVWRGAADAVVGGSLNTSGPLTVLAGQDGGCGLLQQMIGAVERALASRARIERSVDRVSRAFIPIVMLVALATFVAWRAEPSAAIINAISVLVIACPCALGIATPLAVSSAVAAAARHGVLVSHADVLESAAGIDTVVFDKTGTVTEGRFRLVGFAGEGVDEREAIGHIAPLEMASEHPIARAIVERALEMGISSGPAPNLERVGGSGVRCDGVFAGNEAFASSEAGGGRPIAAALLARAAAWQSEGHTAIFVGWHGAVRGVVGLGDRLRDGAPLVVERLQASGHKVILLSGDSATTTRAVAESLGIRDYVADAKPDRKLEYLKELKAGGRKVAMVGDGINDAPALAEANLGIAMGSGTALAMEAAHVVLTTPSLALIPATFGLADRTMRTIRRNLFWAFFYNAAGISLAVAGVLNPLLAAGAMVLSSLSVTLQSTLLGRWKVVGKSGPD